MKNKLGNLIKIIGKLMMLTVFISGCVDVPSEYEIQLTISAQVALEEKTRDLLDKAINEVGDQPDKWEDTLKNTIANLGEVGVDTATKVLDKMQSVLENATGYVGSEARCNADFIGHRVQTKLQQIRYDIFGGEEPDLYPIICSISPTDVKPENKDEPIKYFGYDFLEYKNNPNDFRVDLEDKSGNIIKRDFGDVNVAHNYFLQVVLQGENFTGLDPKQYPKLVLKWKDNVVMKEDNGGVWRSEIPIIVPEPIVETPLYKSNAFSVYHYVFTGGNFMTELPNDTFDCGIFGFRVHGQSINWVLDNFMKSESLQVYMRKAGRYWEVIASPGKGPNYRQPIKWETDIICIKIENKDSYTLSSLSGNGNSNIPTGKSATDYVCGVVGLQVNTNPTNIDTSKAGGAPILAAYPIIDNGEWNIKVDMALIGDETWMVNVLCLEKDSKYIVFPPFNDSDFSIDVMEYEATRTTEISSMKKFSDLACGIIGFEALQKFTTVRYESMYYDIDRNSIYTTDPQAACVDDCTILDVRMFLPNATLSAQKQYWKVEARLMWGEITEDPQGAEVYMPNICGCSFWSCPDECGGHMVPTTRYDSVFYSTEWKVKPLCVLIDKNIQLQPNLIP